MSVTKQGRLTENISISFRDISMEASPPRVSLTITAHCLGSSRELTWQLCLRFTRIGFPEAVRRIQGVKRIHIRTSFEDEKAFETYWDL